MHEKRQFARKLAQALVAGDWNAEAVQRRAQALLNRAEARDAIDQLMDAVIQKYGTIPPPPTVSRLIKFLLEQRIFYDQLATGEDGEPARIEYSAIPAPQMSPTPALAHLRRIPPLLNVDELATWLGLTVPELEWFADCGGRERERANERLRHYRYRWLPKRSGGFRLLETPKRNLKELQRRLLHDLLDQIPPHEAAHAFSAGRSIKSFVQPHCGKPLVLRVDLRNFFSSVSATRGFGLFRALGYPEPVARRLCGLCTNSAPRYLFTKSKLGEIDGELRRLQQDVSAPHLPQGAPTSPALANFAAWKLDSRLQGLAAYYEGNYTRYADDLVFSGGRAMAKELPRLRTFILAIVLDEGFRIQHRKTTVMTSGSRQQLAGLVINEHPNIDRQEFDRLRAILFNCRQRGPASQAEKGDVAGLRNHLLGKIAFARMINPAKAHRLEVLFDDIDWDAT